MFQPTGSQQRSHGTGLSPGHSTQRKAAQRAAAQHSRARSCSRWVEPRSGPSASARFASSGRPRLALTDQFACATQLCSFRFHHRPVVPRCPQNFKGATGGAIFRCYPGAGGAGPVLLLLRSLWCTSRRWRSAPCQQHSARAGAWPGASHLVRVLPLQRVPGGNRKRKPLPRLHSRLARKPFCPCRAFPDLLAHSARLPLGGGEGRDAQPARSVPRCSAACRVGGAVTRGPPPALARFLPGRPLPGLHVYTTTPIE